MKVIYKTDGTATIIEEHELTTEQVETMLTLSEIGCWEFRDYGEKDLCRAGKLKASVCDSLMSLGLLDHGDEMAWHITFYITEKGKKFIKCLNIHP